MTNDNKIEREEKRLNVTNHIWWDLIRFIIYNNIINILKHKELVFKTTFRSNKNLSFRFRSFSYIGYKTLLRILIDMAFETIKLGEQTGTGNVNKNNNIRE